MQGSPPRPSPRRHEHPADRQPSETDTAPAIPVTIVADPELGEQHRREALELVHRLVHWAPRPVLHARVTLRLLPDPALERPMIAKATLDVNGRPVRAHIAAETIELALGRLEERLRRNLEDLEATWRSERHSTGVVLTGEWRHGDLPSTRPEYVERPVEERELVRRKTYAVSALTPEMAVVEMEALDHDFYLFENIDTGEDGVVYRRPAGGFGLLCVHPPEAPQAGARTPVPADPVPAPVLSLEDAIERMDVSGERFLFFVDPQMRRGNVLYRRYDGHNGLIEWSSRSAWSGGERGRAGRRPFSELP